MPINSKSITSPQQLSRSKNKISEELSKIGQTGNLTEQQFNKTNNFVNKEIELMEDYLESNSELRDKYDETIGRFRNQVSEIGSRFKPTGYQYTQNLSPKEKASFQNWHAKATGAAKQNQAASSATSEEMSEASHGMAAAPQDMPLTSRKMKNAGSSSSTVSDNNLSSSESTSVTSQNMPASSTQVNGRGQFKAKDNKSSPRTTQRRNASETPTQRSNKVGKLPAELMDKYSALATEAKVKQSAKPQDNTLSNYRKHEDEGMRKKAVGELKRSLMAREDMIKQQVEKLKDALKLMGHNLPKSALNDLTIQLGKELETFSKSNRDSKSLEALKKSCNHHLSVYAKEAPQNDPLLTRIHHRIVTTFKAFLNWCDWVLSKITGTMLDKKEGRKHIFTTPALPVEEGKQRLAVFTKELDKMTDELELVVTQTRKPQQ